MSSIWLSSCTRWGSILAQRFLLQEGTAAAVARQRRRTDSQDSVAHLVELDDVKPGRRRPIAQEQQVPGRSRHEEDVTCRLSFLFLRLFHRHLLGGRCWSLVEQCDDALDQLTQPVERR